MLVCAAFSGGAGASDAGALLEAARRGDTAQVASLLERKVEVDAASADGSTRCCWPPPTTTWRWRAS